MNRVYLIFAALCVASFGCSSLEPQIQTDQLGSTTPLVLVHVQDESGKPMNTAHAILDKFWMGPPYRADNNGTIRVHASRGRDILVFAPGYKQVRVPISAWKQDRKETVTMISKEK